ncbi:23S rRNA (guanosine(2251)-2'-O)-methyltransferase RlmB [Sporolactobacillus inulinus]|uniref:RNA methyltransferase n=1 Tax=Sporolactobacillus inulinus CASD TaxID=1069536 RepID=A0A0U1QNV5_9BACL|nr:23S rRNA (guanosine(2251)-2'-O)-methyltransferase RlmB [Sporolactobacillus inulinus]KLI02497.1 RNA methyltransferase [Sporolactobacillus inulinus CASD]GEB77085.1 23S rRNA (guanosine(2251)-2'-O)-methyltransferase RlmB [Sporolactobacillus inulinus]
MSDEWIIGRHPVSEAVRSGREINKVWLNKEGRGLGDLLDLIKSRGIAFQFVPKKKLDQLSKSTQHQGVVASIAAYRYAEIDDLFALAVRREEQPFFMMLDNVEDPHNLGSILRTADASGCHGIIIPKRRSVGLTSVVAKASTGAIEYVPVARVANLASTIDALKKQGVWFAGTAADGSEDYRSADFTMPLCLVIGNEGAGMSQLIRKKCDFLIRLPMKGKVTSLNASVAASLLMYEVLRRREKQG